ncbi:MAG: DUF2334 domain-containing protein [Ignavibacteria bacterium]|nr:DUF2334 domain-containing protein [Ignavibacteria bacterium]
MRTNNILRIALILILTIPLLLPGTGLLAQSKVHIIFRIDDFGIDNAEFYQGLFAVLKQKNIRMTLAVVPFKQGNEDTLALTSKQREILQSGIDMGVVEMAMHGATHRNNNTELAPSEYISRPMEKQYQELRRGKSELERVFHKEVNIFVPPWNTYDENTLWALEKAGFKIISGALYGAPAVNNGIRYLPYSTTLDDINRVLQTIPAVLNEGKVVVVLLHGYDFVENKSFYYQPQWDRYMKSVSFSFERFATLVEDIERYKNCEICSFGDIDRNKYDHVFLESNRVPSYILPVPILLNAKDNGYYPVERSKSSDKLHYVYYPIILVVCVMLFGFFIAFMFHMFMDKREIILGKLNYTLLALVFISLFVLLFKGGSIYMLIKFFLSGILLLQIYKSYQVMKLPKKSAR